MFVAVGLWCCCPSSTSCVGFAYAQGDSMWLGCGLLFRLLDLRSQASSKALLSSCFNDGSVWRASPTANAQGSTRESVRDVPGGCPCSQPKGPQRSGA